MRVEERGRSEQYLVPDWVRTPELYMPSRRKAHEMTVAQLKRGLCFKSGGDWRKCQTCLGKCTIGEQMVKYMTGVEEPPEEAVRDVPLCQAAPEKPLPMPENASSRTKYAIKKRRELAERVVKLVEGGMPFAHAAKEVGYTGSGMRNAMRQLGMAIPINPDMQKCRAACLAKGTDIRSEKRLREAIERYIAVTDAIAAGMKKDEAARIYGGYKAWHSCRNFGNNHRTEIEAVRAEKLKSQAVAD